MSTAPSKSPKFRRDSPDVERTGSILSARPPARIVIVGGGPAGAATARALRRLAPRLADRTLLLERAPAARDKLCGGGLTGACVRKLHSLGLEVRVPAVTIRRAVFAFGDHKMELPIGSESYVVRRVDFDDDLLEQVTADVEVRRGERVLGLHRTDGGVYVETERELHFADLVIGADGVGSLVRRFLFQERGLPREAVTRLLQCDIALPFRPAEADAMTFDLGVLKEGIRGYFWTFPSLMDGEPMMNTGIMHLPPYGPADVKAVLRSYLARYDYAEAENAEPRLRAHPELAYDPRRPIGGESLMLVGDAAGIENLTGEGLAQCVDYGIRAATLARRQIQRGSRDFGSFRRRILRSPLGREMAIARLLASRVYGPSWPFWCDLLFKRPVVGRLMALQTEGRDRLDRHIPRLLLNYALHRLRWRAHVPGGIPAVNG